MTIGAYEDETAFVQGRRVLIRDVDDLHREGDRVGRANERFDVRIRSAETEQDESVTEEVEYRAAVTEPQVRRPMTGSCCRHVLRRVIGRGRRSVRDEQR
jgi:hypothetical protein